MVEELGHQALFSVDGAIAKAFLLEEKVDLILLDWNMPIMTGPEFLEINKKKLLTLQ